MELHDGDVDVVVFDENMALYLLQSKVLKPQIFEKRKDLKAADAPYAFLYKFYYNFIELGNIQLAEDFNDTFNRDYDINLLEQTGYDRSPDIIWPKIKYNQIEVLQLL